MSGATTPVSVYSFQKSVVKFSPVQTSDRLFQALSRRPTSGAISIFEFRSSLATLEPWVVVTLRNEGSVSASRCPWLRRPGPESRPSDEPPHRRSIILKAIKTPEAPRRERASFHVRERLNSEYFSRSNQVRACKNPVRSSGSPGHERQLPFGGGAGSHTYCFPVAMQCISSSRSPC